MDKNSGFLLVDKPINRSSHSIINQLRRITKIRRIGHAGTLDPRATGLLVVAVGRAATKRINQFVKMDKVYEAKIFLGAETDTYDAEGKILHKYSGPKIKKSEIILKLKEFIGQQEQIPPMYSAKKFKGKKLYELARKNIEIERTPSRIEIYKIKLLKYQWPNLNLQIYCSSGTYIRSLAYDLGKKLKCGAYLLELRRTKIGRFKIDKAQEIAKINEKNWQKYLFD